MRGYKYHFNMDNDNQILTIRPTKGTYAKAFAPALVL